MAPPTSVEEARVIICEIGRRLWQRGMVAANDGNVSIRVGDQVVCTPTGISKGFMDPFRLPVVALDGTVLDGTAPSTEIKMHLRVYREAADIRSVVHAHPMFATMWAIIGQPIRALALPESVVTMPCIPLAPYATPSTEGVPESVAPFIHSYKACLLEHHGALTWGGDPITAYETMERLEYTSELTWRLSQAGILRELPAEEIARICQIFGTTLPLDSR